MPEEMLAACIAVVMEPSDDSDAPSWLQVSSNFKPEAQSKPNKHMRANDKQRVVLSLSAQSVGPCLRIDVVVPHGDVSLGVLGGRVRRRTHQSPSIASPKDPTTQTASFCTTTHKHTRLAA